MPNEVLEGELFKSYHAALEASAKEVTDCKAIAARLLAVRLDGSLEQEQWATDYGRKIDALHKAIEARRDNDKRPWWLNYKAIQDAPKEALDLLASIRAHLKAEIKRSALARQAAQAPSLELAAATGAGPSELASMAAATSRVADGARLDTAWTWAPADGGPRPVHVGEAVARGLQIPAEYWILDTKRLDREARTNDGRDLPPGALRVNDPRVVFTP